ncbi:ABC transporter permease [Myxococcus sp. K15C18031901]|uniref:ABC transporter permease n=1 Tax=Myxococcus dinghuensis TaxID=2906761 RepID=UPI0020A823A2|nr:ABC transporter permease [Myxococcus dinghuensis]MCP3100065.1 ABC transporter permease [Myxococcus dinghuensis]
MDSLLQDVRHALRRLGRGPTFTLVAVATLALGIGANVAIFSVVRTVLLRPLPMHDDARLVRLYSVGQRGPGPTSPPDLADLREQTRSFVGLTAATSTEVTLGADSMEPSPEKRQAGLVTADFFQVLGPRIQLGRAFHPEDGLPGAPKVAVLSHALWQRRFGGRSDIVGRTLNLGAPEPFTVVGVTAEGFDFPAHAELWTPLTWDESMTSPESRGAHWLEVYGRLSPGVTLEQAREEVSTVARNLADSYPKTNTNLGARVEALRDVLLGPSRPSLLMLTGAVGFVLLIACANLTHLLLARAASREGDLSIRLALGASRGRLARELLVETGVLALVGGATGLLVSMWALDVLVALGPRDIPRLDEVAVDGDVLAFTVGVSVLTLLMAGLVPALVSTRLDLGRGLRIAGTGAGGSALHHRTHSLLIIGETAIAVVLLVSAGLLLRSFVTLRGVDPGFQPDGVLTLRLDLPPNRYPIGSASPLAFHDQLLSRLRGLPGVESAGAIAGLPMDGGKMLLEVKDPARPMAPDAIPWQASVRIVTPGALEALRVKVLDGRGLTSEDRGAGGRAVLVNAEAARRFWPGEPVLGRTLDTTMNWGNGNFGGRVVGVVEDMAIDGLAAPAVPEVYVPYEQARGTSMTLVLRTSGNPLTLAGAVRDELRALDPRLALGNVRTLSSVVDGTVAPLRFYLLLVGIFAATAMALAAVGLYGVVTHVVSRRTREMGIRLALGARVHQVTGLVLSRYLGLTLVGLVVGLGLSVTASRALTHLLGGVPATDPLTYALVPLLLVAVAALAIFIPARRAARVSPAVSLRAD